MWSSPTAAAAESALAQRAGLLTYGHTHLRAAVWKRWLQDENTVHEFRQRLVRYFLSAEEPTDRAIDEVPWQLMTLEDWIPLKEFLADLRVFLQMRNSHRKWELHRYWLKLDSRFDPVQVYNAVLVAATASGALAKHNAWLAT